MRAFGVRRHALIPWCSLRFAISLVNSPLRNVDRSRPTRVSSPTSDRLAMPAFSQVAQYSSSNPPYVWGGPAMFLTSRDAIEPIPVAGARWIRGLLATTTPQSLNLDQNSLSTIHLEG